MAHCVPFRQQSQQPITIRVMNVQASSVTVGALLGVAAA